MEKNNQVVYGIVNNIPQTYHSSDLRNFFSQFIETKGFKCFHFRHRPEKQISTKSSETENEIKTFCCVFRTVSERLDNLIRLYNKKHWLDKHGDSLSTLCYISKVSVSQNKETEKQYVRRAEIKQIPADREEFTETDLLKLRELHPPDIMPNGNVGTPTKVFLDLIQQCRLPPVVISKLGLTFPKTRTNKKYGDVPFDYGAETVEYESADLEETVISCQGHELLNEGELNKTVISCQGNELLNEGELNKTVISCQGHELLNEGELNKTVISGQGNELLNEGELNKTVISGQGHELLNEGELNKTVISCQGHELLNEGELNKTVISCQGHELLNEGELNKTVISGQGNELLNEGELNKTVISCQGHELLNEGELNKTVISCQGHELLNEGELNKTVISCQGHELLNEGELNKTVISCQGHELLNEGELNKTVISGQGNELLNEGELNKSGESKNNKMSENSEIHQSDNDRKKGKGKKSGKRWRSDPETKKRMNERIEEKMMGESDHSEGDDDSCEEWERHEALHDDPDNQERNDERLFENEIELKWEKGGSGLVFYTDAQHWKEQEGDFDEQTTDDWDVDMSIYYEKGGGDKDAKDFVSMRQSERWRDGTDNTDRFSLGFAKKRKKGNENLISKDLKIGKFEVHTKGIGRKILEKQGWQEGQGIGSSVEGIMEALENEGQPPSVKAGLGYHGEKLIRNQPRTAERDVVIATVYDKPEDIQKKEPLLRRHDHYTISYRDSVHFKKAESENT